jgi:hypothetical protein
MHQLMNLFAVLGVVGMTANLASKIVQPHQSQSPYASQTTGFAPPAEVGKSFAPSAR